MTHNHMYAGSKREGLAHIPVEPPVLRVSGEEIFWPLLTIAWQTVKKLEIQLHKNSFMPNILSLNSSFMETMVFNSELKYKNIILSVVSLCSD